MPSERATVWSMGRVELVRHLVARGIDFEDDMTTEELRALLLRGLPQASRGRTMAAAAAMRKGELVKEAIRMGLDIDPKDPPIKGEILLQIRARMQEEAREELEAERLQADDQLPVRPQGRPRPSSSSSSSSAAAAAEHAPPPHGVAPKQRAAASAGVPGTSRSDWKAAFRLHEAPGKGVAAKGEDNMDTAWSRKRSQVPLYQMDDEDEEGEWERFPVPPSPLGAQVQPQPQPQQAARTPTTPASQYQQPQWDQATQTFQEYVTILTAWQQQAPSQPM